MEYTAGAASDGRNLGLYRPRRHGAACSGIVRGVAIVRDKYDRLDKRHMWLERTDAHVGRLREGNALAVCLRCKPFIYMAIDWAVASWQTGRLLESGQLSDYRTPVYLGLLCINPFLEGLGIADYRK